MAKKQNISITLDNGSVDHGWQVLATLLGCGSVGMLAWAISNAGQLDLAATALTVFFFQLVSLMIKGNLIVLPSTATSTFKGTAGFVDTFLTEFREFQARSPIWRLAAMAFAYTLFFLVARLAMSFSLNIFSNIWIAGAGAALLASIIIAPTLFGKMFASMKTRAGVRTSVSEDAAVADTTVPTHAQPPERNGSGATAMDKDAARGRKGNGATPAERTDDRSGTRQEGN